MSNKIEGIWIGEQDLSQDEGFLLDAQNEMQSPSLVDAMSDSKVMEEVGGDRRDFLKMMGFGLGAATIAAGCDIPVRRAIPYVIKPDAIVPGVATYYASTVVDGGDSCAVLVKTREGRPIKIEGNNMSGMTQGGTSARVQASVLSLYDVNRLKAPSIAGEAASWTEVDRAVGSALASAKGIRLVTKTILSPTARKAVASIQSKFPTLEVITYDSVSAGAILESNEQSFGDRAIPQYRFDKAEQIVSFNADFLGTWISPIEFASQYSKGRKIDDAHHAKLSHHIQVESQMSISGSNADNRILVKPSEQGAAIAFLYGELTGSSSTTALNDGAKKAFRALAQKLKDHRGKSLVISGSTNTSEQILINAINDNLGNYGHTLSFDHASLQRQGDEKELTQLVADIKSGRVDTVIYHKCNPAFEYANIPELTSSLVSVSNSIALNYDICESTAVAKIVAPVHHDLESWGDAEAKRGIVNLLQPTISPLFDTRQAAESLLTWAGDSDLESDADQPYFEYLKKAWQSEYFSKQSDFISFQSFWDKALHDGLFSSSDNAGNSTFSGDASGALRSIAAPGSSDIEISFTEPISIGNGVHANNPWLQEMPDPITRCAWGNYLAVPVSFDGVKKFKGLNGLKDGELADLTINGQTYRVPVVQQFGQMPGTVSLALGYGRSVIGDAGYNIGVNVNPSIGFAEGRSNYFATDVLLSGSKGKEDEYSSVQYHNTIGVTAPDKKTGETINADETALAPGYGNIAKGYQGSLVERTIIRHSHVDDLEHSVEELIHEREHYEGLNAETLYPYSKYVAEKYSQGHHWGMHVDLNACTGCGACTVACMAENNIPVVGKHRVSKHQEMAWLRIDRYYYGDVNNPSVVYQPMMCQHCDNAPCENVCPVNATNHSSEGLNQMTYNRCIGTRYCANNCPYKVRRFNWMDYTTADIFPANQVQLNEEAGIPYGADNLTRMVLNPDVTVRSRGVIEKCSFCVQRIQEGKLTAKLEKRALKDTDVITACQSACPTGAITFGDQNNAKGELSKKFDSSLNMIVLEEINVRPSVQYTMKVHNRDESLEA